VPVVVCCPWPSVQATGGSIANQELFLTQFLQIGWQNELLKVRMDESVLDAPHHLPLHKYFDYFPRDLTTPL